MIGCFPPACLRERRNLPGGWRYCRIPVPNASEETRARARWESSCFALTRAHIEDSVPSPHGQQPLVPVACGPFPLSACYVDGAEEHKQRDVCLCGLE